MQPENTCRHYSGLERLPIPFTNILLFNVNILLKNKKDSEHQYPKNQTYTLVRTVKQGVKCIHEICLCCALILVCFDKY